MRPLPRVETLLFNQPLAVTPEVAEIVASVVLARNEEPNGKAWPEPEASRFTGKPVGFAGTEDAWRMEDGIAIVPIIGELVNRGAWVGASSGLVSYEGLQATLKALENDPAVRGVVLDINSPGGHGAGAMETAAAVRALAAIKPVVALANSMAASAAYAIASGASEIIAQPSASLGSIGVVWLHMDRSAQMERAGVKPTLITAGAFKADGHPFAALPDEARGRIQSQIDQSFALFVDTVARHRGADPQAIRALEAGIFMGEAAVSAGLADTLGTLDTALSRVRARLTPTKPTIGAIMTAETNTPDVNAVRADAAREARETFAIEVSAALAALFPDNARAGAFTEALVEGLSPAAAAKLAQRVPLPEAASPAAAGPVLDKKVPRPNIAPDEAETAATTANVNLWAKHGKISVRN